MDRADIAERVLQAVERWRDRYRPSCAESIYQVDACTIAATELVEDTLNIAGYANDRDCDASLPQKGIEPGEEK